MSWRFRGHQETPLNQAGFQGTWNLENMCPWLPWHWNSQVMFRFFAWGCCFGGQVFHVFSTYLPCIFHPIYIFGEFRSPNLAPFPTFQGLPGCKRWPWERSYYHILFRNAVRTQHGHFPKLKNTLKILAKPHCAKGKIVNQRRDVALSWEKTCQLSIAEFIVRWPGGVFMMPVKIHFFRVSIWTWMWKKHFSIFSEFTCLNVQRNFVQHFFNHLEHEQKGTAHTNRSSDKKLQAIRFTFDSQVAIQEYFSITNTT